MTKMEAIDVALAKVEAQKPSKIVTGEKAERIKIETKRQEEIKTNIQQLLKIFEEDIIESFADETGEAWAYYCDGTEKRFHAIESTAYKDYLRFGINLYSGKPRENWIEPIAKLIASKARRNGRRKLHIRYANINGVWHWQTSEEENIQIIEEKPAFDLD